MKALSTLFFLLIIPFFLRAQVIPDQSTLMARAPASFFVTVGTSKGNIMVEVLRDWSPAGADRFYQLIQTGFYTQNRFFRVQKGYVVQFGICDNRDVNYFWDKRPIQDEPVVHSNLKGTISYARDGANSRTSQIFINLKDNVKLDTVNYNGLRGFPPFARIVDGFEIIESLFPDYGFEPANHQDSMMVYGNAYLNKKFPLLDYIIDAGFIQK